MPEMTLITLSATPTTTDSVVVRFAVMDTIFLSEVPSTIESVELSSTPEPLACLSAIPLTIDSVLTSPVPITVLSTTPSTMLSVLCRFALPTDTVRSPSPAAEDVEEGRSCSSARRLTTVLLTVAST